jgi:CRP/FNR family transcriptional regulator
VNAQIRPASEEILTLWRRIAFLQSVPGPIVHTLAALATRRTCLRGEVIFQEDEPTAGLFLIETGTVKICRFSMEGREYILQFLHPGDTFNDVSALDGGGNPATAIALTDAVLWRVARTDLRRVVQQHPELAWAIIENMAGRARLLVGIVHDLAMRGVRGRLARLLLEQAETAERGEPTDPLTQEEIASRLGTVREVVGRTLRGMANDGMISMERQQIVILDRTRLTEEAEV